MVALARGEKYEDFAKKRWATLNASGLRGVKMHGFDNWGREKFDWVKDMARDPTLSHEIDELA